MHARIIGCLFGHHRPQRSDVRVSDGSLVGRCRYCKTPLVQRARHDWVRDPERRALQSDA